MKNDRSWWIRAYSAGFGCSAVIALAGVAVYAVPAGQDVTTTADETTVVTTPPESPDVAKAVPGITGPAPLFAGEAPDSNPQSPIP